MPYRRRGYRRRYRRSYGRRRSRYGYFGKFGSHASSAYSMAKKALSLINVEKKYLDVQYSITPDVTLQPNALLNGLSQGDTSITRNGDSIKFVSLFIRINFLIHTSATNTRVRFLLVRDKQPNGAVFANTTILAAVSNILSPRNLDWNKRFKVYRDTTIELNTDFPEKTIQIYLGKLSFHTRYIDGNDTVASISTNSLYICHMSDEATNTPTVTGYCRIRFIDN